MAERFSGLAKNGDRFRGGGFRFDQMARAPICMRPLAPGVPGFAYERVALADFSLPSRIFVPLAVLSLSLLTPGGIRAFMGYRLSVSRR